MLSSLSFHSDSQRQDLIATIVGQYAELHGPWMHLRVTTLRRMFPAAVDTELVAMDSR
jgi:hypothetical protein